jgi:hypothetical protein
MTMSGRELWISLVRLKPLSPERLRGRVGAFTNIVTWASDAAEFRKKADIIAGKLELCVVEIEGQEPLATRTEKWGLTEEVEERVSRAESNPNAIICGTSFEYPSKMRECSAGLIRSIGKLLV